MIVMTCIMHLGEAFPGKHATTEYIAAVAAEIAERAVNVGEDSLVGPGLKQILFQAR